MNADIRLSVDFFNNVKVKKLKKRLGTDGILALIALWTYCAKNSPSGMLGERSNDEDVELMADWDGEEGAFAAALKDLGFIDVWGEGEFMLHDWTEHNPYVAESGERGNAQRLNRLGRQNPAAFQAARDLELRGITKETYYAVRNAKSYDEALSYLRVPAPQDDEMTADDGTILDDAPAAAVPQAYDRSTTVVPQAYDRSTTGLRQAYDSSTPAPDPDPDPVPAPMASGLKKHACPVPPDEPNETPAKDRVSYPPRFEAFWRVYPSVRRLKKSGTFARWERLVKSGVPPESLETAARNYAKLCAIERRAPSNVMHSTTFLGVERAWEDYAPGGAMADAGIPSAPSGCGIRDYDEARTALLGRFGPLREEEDVGTA